MLTRRNESLSRRYEIPIFDGENPENWVVLVEEYFAIGNFTEAQKLQVARNCFDDEACWEWYRWERDRNPFASWDQMKLRVLETFSLPQDSTLGERRTKIMPLTRNEIRENLSAMAESIEEIKKQLSGLGALLHFGKRSEEEEQQVEIAHCEERDHDRKSSYQREIDSRKDSGAEKVCHRKSKRKSKEGKNSGSGSDLESSIDSESRKKKKHRSSMVRGKGELDQKIQRRRQCRISLVDSRRKMRKREKEKKLGKEKRVDGDKKRNEKKAKK